MNDEACPYYEDIIDNMFTGHQWIKNEFDFIRVRHVGHFQKSDFFVNLYQNQPFFSNYRGARALCEPPSYATI